METRASQQFYFNHHFQFQWQKIDCRWVYLVKNSTNINISNWNWEILLLGVICKMSGYERGTFQKWRRQGFNQSVKVCVVKQQLQNDISHCEIVENFIKMVNYIIQRNWNISAETTTKFWTNIWVLNRVHYCISSQHENGHRKAFKQILLT